MANETSDRPRLTPKGARTRARIVEEAAALIHERGVAGTTLEDVKVAAEVSGSQMYHYFPDKNELVQAVIDYQADAIVKRNAHALASANGVEAWRKMVITAARRTQAQGRLPTWFAWWSTRRERPRGPSAHRGRVRSVGSRHQRWTQTPPHRGETPVRHRPGRPRHDSARHARRRASTRPGSTETSVRSKLRSTPSSLSRSAVEPSQRARRKRFECWPVFSRANGRSDYPRVQGERCNECNGPMELAGLEPATSWVRSRRSPN